MLKNSVEAVFSYLRCHSDLQKSERRHKLDIMYEKVFEIYTLAFCMNRAGFVNWALVGCMLGECHFIISRCVWRDISRTVSVYSIHIQYNIPLFYCCLLTIYRLAEETCLWKKTFSRRKLHKTVLKVLIWWKLLHDLSYVVHAIEKTILSRPCFYRLAKYSMMSNLGPVS